MTDDTREVRTPLRFKLSDGLQGRMETLWTMRAVVEDAQHSPRVKRRAQALVGRSLPDCMGRVYSWMRRSFVFIRDPDEIERVYFPDQILAAQEGERNEVQRDPDGVVGFDCDESTTLTCSLLKVMGIETAFVMVGRTPETAGGQYEHVFAAARDATKVWRAMDAQEGLSPVGALRLSDWPTRLLFPVDLSIAAMQRAGLAP